MPNSIGKQTRVGIRHGSAILVAFVFFAQTAALPVHVGLMLLPPNTAAMTHGCDKGTCCTPLCFLDKRGVHHCVHMSAEDSCSCALSQEDCTVNPIFMSAIVILPRNMSLIPNFVPARWIFPVPNLYAGRDPATPTLPPKQ